MEPSHLERHQSPSRTALTVAMLDQRGQLLRAALGFAGLSRPPYDRALWRFARRLLGWHRKDCGRHGAPRLRPPTHPLRRARRASNLLHDRDGALAHERGGHWVGAHAVARDTAGGVGGAEEARGGQVMMVSIEEEGRASFERRLLGNYDLDATQFRRIGFFFLVHHHIDIKVIALVVKSETDVDRGVGGS